ncbi:MAG: hypothetical protein FWH24_00145 [Oscillospiraceae bacterium]|nr:hypothetical protein [Oscillospiraceae bacterium]
MKKILSFVLCAAIISILAITPAMAFMQLEAPKITMTLDGVRDDGYSGPYNINNFWEGGTDSGATGQVWTAWDDDYLYYYFEIKDDTPNHEHSNDYEVDCVEMFFDWYNNKDDDTSDVSKPYWQYRIAAAPDMDGRQFSNGINQAAGEDGTGWSVQEHLDSMSANSVVNLVSGGYNVETRTAYKAFGVNLNEGSVVGVDFMIGDNQTDEGRTSGAFLTPDYASNEHWQWPNSVGGELTLLGAPAAPAAVEEDPGTGAGGGDPAELAPAPAPAPAPQTADPVSLIVLGSLAGAAGVLFAAKKRR